MSEKIRTFVKSILIPSIISRKKSELQTTSDVALKEWSIHPFDNDGAFMMTICYKLKVALNVDGDSHTLSVFLKMTPTLEEEYYRETHFDALFRNEAIAYETLLPALDARIHCPRLHYYDIGYLTAALAISDFTNDGFAMSKPVLNLPLDHILTTMKSLGTFHGASFAMKYAQPDRFDALKNGLGENFLRRRHHATYELILMNATRRALHSYRISGATTNAAPESFLRSLEWLLINRLNEYRLALSVPHEPLAIVCHGDMIRNNIAFKYDSNGLAIDALLFDWQTIAYASPMLDFGLFLAISTGHEIRRRYFDEIFRTYYDAVIARFSEKTHLDSEQIPSYLSCDALMWEYARHAPYCFHVAAYFIAELLEPQGDFFSNDNLNAVPLKIFTMGGEDVDRETAAQITEIYELCVKCNVTLSALVDI